MIKIEQEEFNHRTVLDTENAVSFQEQWQCHNCDGWFDEEDIIWANVVDLNERTGIQVPWCDKCLAEEDPQFDTLVYF